MVDNGGIWDEKSFKEDRDHIRDLEKQNAKMLEALEAAIKYVPELADVPGIKAAIAAAKGE